MVSLASNVSYSGSRKAPVLLMDWRVAGIEQPELPVPEAPTPTPPEMPGTGVPLGAPAPAENPIPVREPPSTLEPQS
jgi:hypothetical protein